MARMGQLKKRGRAPAVPEANSPRPAKGMKDEESLEENRLLMNECQIQRLRVFMIPRREGLSAGRRCAGAHVRPACGVHSRLEGVLQTKLDLAHRDCDRR